VKPIPELRYRELERLLELYDLIKETPEGGACNRLSVEYRTMILADVNRAVIDTFGGWGVFNEKDKEQCSWLIITMLESGVMPLKGYLRGIL